ncbi:amicyanin [Paracoccus sp. (in: a-proteobacteria)]|uniref:amicyanin n=1 Tax=Paracoccus sp. TaxID=267 RepID=UPI0026DEA704|nr:amicyanin [Paracoccus sp. (in: a-proteobacteria)]MDO5370955.1 amicyanin [Paracoccus sp. (in: a-proteobacteria)]
MTFATKTRTILAALVLTGFGTQMALADKISILTEAPAAAAEAPTDAVIVNIAKMKYEPAEVTIKPGQTVTWINTEAMPHNVAFKAGAVGDAKMDGAMMKKEQSYSITFNEAGSYDYHCTPHPFMKAKVIVE